MQKSPVREKALLFGVEIIKLANDLERRKFYVLAKQVLRSGTSIGANLAESFDAQSRNDFLSKINIALKEARETEYWFHLLELSGIYTSSELSCGQKLNEILAMLVATKKTIKRNSK